MSKNFSAPSSAPNPASVTGDSNGGKGERHSGGGDGVAAVGDVGERSAVHYGRGSFQGLHEIGVKGVLEQNSQTVLAGEV